MAKTKNKAAKKPSGRNKSPIEAAMDKPEIKRLNGLADAVVNEKPSEISCPACGSKAEIVDEGEYGCTNTLCGWLGTPEDAKTFGSVDGLKAVADIITEPTGPFTAEELAAYDADTVRLVSEAEDRAKSAESTYENSKAVASEDKKRYEARVDELRKLIHDRADNRGKRPQKTLLDHVPAWRKRNVTAIALAFDGAKEAVEIAIGAGIKTLGDLYEQIGPDHTQATTTLWTAEVVEQLRAACQKYIDAETAEAPPAAPELWREYPIDRWTRFGLTSKDVEKLHSGEAKGGGGHPIITVGDLNRFVTPNPANPSYARGYGDIKGIGAAGVDRISEAETKFWAWWKGEGEAAFALERAPKAELEPAAEAEPEPAAQPVESEAA